MRRDDRHPAPLGVAAAALLLALAPSPRPAQAECLPDSASVGDGEAVACSGVITLPYLVPTAVGGVTITIDSTGRLTAFGDAISVNDGSHVANAGTIRVDGASSRAILGGNGVSALDRSSYSNGASGRLELSGVGTSGIVVGDFSAVDNDGVIDGADSNHTGIEVGDASSVSNTGTISLAGDGSRAIAGDNGASATELAIFGNAASGVISLGGANSAGIATGKDTLVTNDGSIVVSGSGSRAVQVGNASFVDNAGTIRVDGAGSWAIVGGNGANSTELAIFGNAASGVITLGGADSAGIATGNNTRVTNDGSIVVSGSGSRAVQVGNASFVDNAGTITIGGAGGKGLVGGASARVTNAAGASVLSTAADSRAIEVGSRGNAINAGAITIDGANSRGLGGADGISSGAPTRFSNQAGATIDVAGANVFGVHFGRFADGSNDGAITTTGSGATAVRIGDDSSFRNLAAGQIAVTGANGRGVVAGAGSSSRVENDGWLALSGNGGTAISVGSATAIRNTGTIEVAGTDSVGLSIAGYAAASQDPNYSSFWNTEDPASGRAGSLRSLDPAAGPLVRFGAAAASRENRVLNWGAASIVADLSDAAQPGRGIAIQGGTGVDVVANAGLIEGKVRLDAGDDVYRQSTDGTFSAAGLLDGGAGSDTIELRPGSTAIGHFRLGAVRNFEQIQIDNGAWQLSGVAQGATPLSLRIGTTGTLQLSSPLHVTGDLVHESDGNAATRSVVSAVLGADAIGAPLLQVDGDASGLDQASLELVVGGGISGNVTFTIMKVDGTLTEQYGEVVPPGGFGLGIGDLVYTAANEIQLSVLIPEYSDNEAALSRYLGIVSAGAPAPDVQNLLDALGALDWSTYAQAMNQLHPEAYDAQTSALLALGDRFTQLMLERPRYCIGAAGERTFDTRTQLACRERRWEPWLAAYGQVRTRDGEPGHISYQDDGAGLAFGLDRRFGQRWLVSGSVGTAYDIVRVDAVGKGRLSTLDLGMQAGYSHGPLRLQGVASYSHGWHHSYRNIRIPGVARTAEGRFGSNRLGTRLDGGWDFDLHGLTLTPGASVDYTALFRPMIEETGAGLIGLRIDPSTDHVVSIRAGLELSTAFNKDDYWSEWLESIDGVWRPSLALRWKQVVAGSERSLTSAFLGTPTAGRFRVMADDADRGFEIGAGIDFTPKLANRITIGLRYDAFLWEGISSHDFGGRLRFSF